jgi:hypothetical protein
MTTSVGDIQRRPQPAGFSRAAPAQYAAGKCREAAQEYSLGRSPRVAEFHPLFLSREAALEEFNTICFAR